MDERDALIPRETVYKVVRIFRNDVLKSAITHDLVYELNVWTVVPLDLRGLLFAWSTLEAAKKFVEVKISHYKWIETYGYDQPFRIYKADAGGMIIQHDGKQRVFHIGNNIWEIWGRLYPNIVLCEAIRLIQAVK